MQVTVKYQLTTLVVSQAKFNFLANKKGKAQKVQYLLKVKYNQENYFARTHDYPSILTASVCFIRVVDHNFV